MGTSVEEADRMSYWKFTALVTVWNERHDADKLGEPVDPPDEDFVEKRQRFLIERGYAQKVLH